MGVILSNLLIYVISCFMFWEAHALWLALAVGSVWKRMGHCYEFN